MSYGEMLYVLALAALGGAFAYLVCPTRRDAVNVAIFFQVSFWFRAGLVILNNNLNFFVQKYASDFSIGLMDQKGGLLAMFAGNNAFSVGNLTSLKFFLEALINLPAVRIFEDSTVMLNFTNAFIGAVTGIVVFAYSRRMFNERIATFGLLIASLYPAALNFSFFALRDIIIYFFLLTNIFSFAWVMLRRDYRLLNWFIYFASFFCCVLLRMTFTPFLAVLPGWFIFRWAWRQAMRESGYTRRIFFAMVTAAMLTVSGGAALLAGYFLVLHQVGITSLVTPDVLLQDYASQRAQRGTTGNEYSPAAGTGAASEYLPIALYNRIPWFARATVQIVGFIELPYPWQWTGVSRILALLDSVFVWIGMFWVWKLNRMLKLAWQRRGPPLPDVLKQYNLPTLHRLSIALMLAFVASWIGFGLLVSDAGNAFRMRVSVEPFLVFGATIYAARALRWLEGKLATATRASAVPQLAPGE
jgi:hypothetical protein